MDKSSEMSNISPVQSGLCIDLLRKFEDELGFHYDLVKVADPKWGTIQVG